MLDLSLRACQLSMCKILNKLVETLTCVCLFGRKCYIGSNLKIDSIHINNASR